MSDILFANSLIQKGHDIDEVLESLSLGQLEYRKEYPDTPMTSCFSFDIINAIDVKGMSRSFLMEKWNLDASQIKRAFTFNAEKIKREEIKRLEKTLRDKAIVKGLKNNKSIENLMLEYDVSRSTVYKIAQKKNLLSKGRKKYKRLKNNELDSLKKDVRTLGYSAAAKKYGIALSTAYRLCQSNHI